MFLQSHICILEQSSSHDNANKPNVRTTLCFTKQETRHKKTAIREDSGVRAFRGGDCGGRICSTPYDCNLGMSQLLSPDLNPRSLVVNGTKTLRKPNWYRKLAVFIGAVRYAPKTPHAGTDLTSHVRPAPQSGRWYLNWYSTITSPRWNGFLPHDLKKHRVKNLTSGNKTTNKMDCKTQTTLTSPRI